MIVSAVNISFRMKANEIIAPQRLSHVVFGMRLDSKFVNNQLQSTLRYSLHVYQMTYSLKKELKMNHSSLFSRLGQNE